MPTSTQEGMEMKNLTINKPEILAWRWCKPVVDDHGETISGVWKLGEAPGFLPWWTNEPLVRLSDYEALQTKCEKLAEAFNEWLEKSEWVQETSEAKELGMHRADVMKSRIEVLQAENDKLRSELDAHGVARIAYASEFPPDEDGQPDVVSIQQNIRKLKEAKNVVRGGYQPEFGNYNAKPPSDE